LKVSDGCVIVLGPFQLWRCFGLSWICCQGMLRHWTPQNKFCGRWWYPAAPKYEVVAESRPEMSRGARRQLEKPRCYDFRLKNLIDVPFDAERVNAVRLHCTDWLAQTSGERVDAIATERRCSGRIMDSKASAVFAAAERRDCPALLLWDVRSLARLFATQPVWGDFVLAGGATPSASRDLAVREARVLAGGSSGAVPAAPGGGDRR